MLGSATEAEDIVQDAWLRWQTVTDDVENPAAYLATITTRLSLTALDSARARRETYIGPWLPEPISTEDDPLLGAERAEALSLAVLLLLPVLASQPSTQDQSQVADRVAPGDRRCDAAVGIRGDQQEFAAIDVDAVAGAQHRHVLHRPAIDMHAAQAVGHGEPQAAAVVADP
jgi:hypothetical protein